MACADAQVEKCLAAAFQYALPTILELTLDAATDMRRRVDPEIRGCVCVCDTVCVLLTVGTEIYYITSRYFSELITFDVM